ncbi:hypothetical protein GHT06_012975 [Daphnia sinensis]|uniref:Uncharacterized protein n=1 Tax=Daphnia sinensis TaxID=1820382 RepID=A0AAD5KWS8_9CRUS|nr:hypothetical protein GHT06_012975 [Daphnia sinensis]
MTVTTFRVPVYFITGLVLSSWVSFIDPIYAAPYLAPSTSPRPLDMSSSVSKGFDPLPTGNVTEKPVVVNNNLNENTTLAPKHANHSLVSGRLSHLKDMVSPRAVFSLFGLGADKATKLMNGVENFLNARSDIDEIDNVISVFNKLFLSRGSNAVNNYYTLFANFWVNFDAIAQFVRGIENRIIVRRAEIQAEIAEEEANAVVEETLLSLTAANAQLEDFKNNLENLIQRRGIARIGTAASRKKVQEGTQTEPPSSLDLAHQNSDEIQNEEEDELDTTQEMNSLAEEIPPNDEAVGDQAFANQYVDDEINDLDPSSDTEE